MSTSKIIKMENFLRKQLGAKYYIFEISNGEKWRIPLWKIASSRSQYYATVDEVSLMESARDTTKTFLNDPYEVYYWATGNLNWDDVESEAEKIKTIEPRLDMQDEWVNPEEWEVNGWEPVND